MNIGLKTGVVKLLPHQAEWETNAEETIMLMKTILGDTCIDIQHVGSTSIKHICAKPIIDIAVAINELADILPYNDVLSKNGIFYRKEETTGQLLYLMGDLENEIKTHHIHVVKYNSVNWQNYLNFRDFLNAFPEKARLYNELKQELAKKYASERKLYTDGKGELIKALLKEAEEWKVSFN
ncbi:MAG: GrpB family protein [Ruminococcaceae bacterium]|nr:GrpB family protein [Oscillospiraceae bacterium]